MTDSTEIAENAKDGQVISPSISNRMVKFFNLMNEQNNDRFEASRVMVEPFMIEEDAIRRVCEASEDCLAKFGTGLSIDFRGRSRLTSNVELVKDDLEDFIRTATDEDEPASITLEWRVFDVSTDGIGRSANVAISFATERMKTGQETGMHEINRAAMEVEVSGSDSTWVLETFRRLEPLIKGKSLGGIYYPLWIFRSQFFTGVVAQMSGFIGLFVGMNLYNRFTGGEDRFSTSELILRIKNEDVLAEKINMLTEELLDPELSPWWEPVFSLGSGALAFGVLWVTLGWTLPKLAPPSIISFGSSADKSKRRFALYNGLVFGLLGVSILLPLIRSFIF